MKKFLIILLSFSFIISISAQNADRQTAKILAESKNNTDGKKGDDQILKDIKKEE